MPHCTEDVPLSESIALELVLKDLGLLEHFHGMVTFSLGVLHKVDFAEAPAAQQLMRLEVFE